MGLSFSATIQSFGRAPSERSWLFAASARISTTTRPSTRSEPSSTPRGPTPSTQMLRSSRRLSSTNVGGGRGESSTVEPPPCPSPSSPGPVGVTASSEPTSHRCWRDESPTGEKEKVSSSTSPSTHGGDAGERSGGGGGGPGGAFAGARGGGDGFVFGNVCGCASTVASSLDFGRARGDDGSVNRNLGEDKGGGGPVGAPGATDGGSGFCDDRGGRGEPFLSCVRFLLSFVVGGGCGGGAGFGDSGARGVPPDDRGELGSELGSEMVSAEAEESTTREGFVVKAFEAPSSR